MDAALAGRLRDQMVLAPMTRGGNLPYRRLCASLGASVTLGEMALARRLNQGRRQELALLRRAPDEAFFGVQLAGRTALELSHATALAVERGADFVDLNAGCPIDEMTRRGLGSALLRKPGRIRALIEAMVAAAQPRPVTIKIRLGWDEGHLVHVRAARAAVDGGASAVFVHGRTRRARYRRAASWEAIGEVVEAVPVPVVGNGDILFPHEIEECRQRSGCAGVMVGRGALIKPWIFEEARKGVLDPGPAERFRIYSRYVDLCREHFGDDEHGERRTRDFLLWHLDFWTRYVPRLENGSWPKLQERHEEFQPRSPLEALLARGDAEGIAWLADRLIHGEDRAGPPPPPPPEGARGGGRRPMPEG